MSDDVILHVEGVTKVYPYEFKMSWWNPFIRWPVRTVVYDWDDIRAEAWRQQGATFNGEYVVKWGGGVIRGQAGHE